MANSSELCRIQFDRDFFKCKDLFGTLEFGKKLVVTLKGAGKKLEYLLPYIDAEFKPNGNKIKCRNGCASRITISLYNKEEDMSTIEVTGHNCDMKFNMIPSYVTEVIDQLLILHGTREMQPDSLRKTVRGAILSSPLIDFIKGRTVIYNGKPKFLDASAVLTKHVNNRYIRLHTMNSSEHTKDNSEEKKKTNKVARNRSKKSVPMPVTEAVDQQCQMINLVDDGDELDDIIVDTSSSTTKRTRDAPHISFSSSSSTSREEKTNKRIRKN